MTLTVVRAGGTAGGVTVDFLTHDGTAVSDEEAATSRPGPARSASAAATPRPPSPSRSARTPRVEGDETFTVELLNPRGGRHAPHGSRRRRDAVATVTIVDDETLVQFSGRFMGNMPEVVRTGQMNERVTVHYQAVSGTAISGVDFLPLAGTLTFGAGRVIAADPARHRQGRHRRGTGDLHDRAQRSAAAGRAQARSGPGQGLHDRRRRLRRLQRPLRRPGVFGRRGPEGHADRAARRRPRHDTDGELARRQRQRAGRHGFHAGRGQRDVRLHRQRGELPDHAGDRRGGGGSRVRACSR